MNWGILECMDSYDILVIILSVALGFSIIVWLAVGVLVLQLVKKARETAETAQKTAENVAALTSSFQNAGKAAAFSSAAKQIYKAFNGSKKK